MKTPRRRRLRKKLHGRHLASIAMAAASDGALCAHLCGCSEHRLFARRTAAREIAEPMRRFDLDFKVTLVELGRPPFAQLTLVSVEFPKLRVTVPVAEEASTFGCFELSRCRAEALRLPAFDQYASWSYDQLIVQQPHLTYHGLWRCRHYHFAVCDEADSGKTRAGEGIQEWFHHACRVVTAPIRLVKRPPLASQRLGYRTAEDAAICRNSPRNILVMYSELARLLPTPFPDFALKYSGRDTIIVTERALVISEITKLMAAYRALGDYPSPKFEVAKVGASTAPRAARRSHDLNLIPSRRFPAQAGASLKRLAEEDEDFWSSNRLRLLAQPGPGEKPLPPALTDTTALACFVDASAFPPKNIRTYLSLYERVFIAAPLEDRFATACKAFGATPDELRGVLGLGRAHLLVPQSIDRYPVAWLSQVADSSPDRILLSRRLASAVVVDARARIPLLYPPLAPHERYDVLNSLVSIAVDLSPPQRGIELARFLEDLGSSWANDDWLLNTMGAMGTVHSGFGNMAAGIYERISGRDLRIELTAAAAQVQWAGALKAHLFPFRGDGYDETKACDLLATLYDPLNSTRRQWPEPQALDAIADILAIDNDVALMPFAKEFSSADIVRLRELVTRLTRENLDVDYLRDAISSFNAEVRHYERRPERLKAVNLVGLMATGLAAAGALKAGQPGAELGAALLGILLHFWMDTAPARSRAAGKLIDGANAALALQGSAEPVLVARVNAELNRFKRRCGPTK